MNVEIKYKHVIVSHVITFSSSERNGREFKKQSIKPKCVKLVWSRETLEERSFSAQSNS